MDNDKPVSGHGKRLASTIRERRIYNRGTRRREEGALIPDIRLPSYPFISEGRAPVRVLNLRAKYRASA